MDCQGAGPRTGKTKDSRSDHTLTLTCCAVCLIATPYPAMRNKAAPGKSCYRARPLPRNPRSQVYEREHLPDAFARYKVKSPKSARSVLTAERALVLSCFYTRFHRAEVGVLRCEEDLGTDSGALVTQLR